MTARELIASSLRLGGVLASGETPSADEANDALSTLNQMLSTWSNENLVIYQKVREEFSLTPNTSAYTWGTGGTFNSSRPIEVLRANLEIQGTDPQEIPLKIITTKEYSDLSLKETDSSYPQAVYFDGAFPLLGVTLWPVPNAAEKIAFYSLKPFSTLALSTELSYPPGYENISKSVRTDRAMLSGATLAYVSSSASLTKIASTPRGRANSCRSILRRPEVWLKAQSAARLVTRPATIRLSISCDGHGRQPQNTP